MLFLSEPAPSQDLASPQMGTPLLVQAPHPPSPPPVAQGRKASASGAEHELTTALRLARGLGLAPDDMMAASKRRSRASEGVCPNRILTQQDIEYRVQMGHQWIPGKTRVDIVLDLQLQDLSDIRALISCRWQGTEGSSDQKLSGESTHIASAALRASALGLLAIGPTPDYGGIRSGISHAALIEIIYQARNGGVSGATPRKVPRFAIITVAQIDRWADRMQEYGSALLPDRVLAASASFLALTQAEETAPTTPRALAKYVQNLRKGKSA